MLPMGTIMASCMFVGLIIATPVKPLNRLPLWLRKTGAWVVLAAGLWNVFWYGVQHPTEFWGIAALVSGFLMLLTAMYVLKPSRLPVLLRPMKPLVLCLLLGCALLYAITIARL
ncbi:MAG: hypothetical protein AAF353_08785 [Pseudomonadota bacterium]